MSRPEAPYAVCWSSIAATDAAHDVIRAAQRFVAAEVGHDNDLTRELHGDARRELFAAVRKLAATNARVRLEWGEDAAADEALADAIADAWSDDAGDECAHTWVSTGTNDGGDDSRFHGEGRTLCSKCGADGDG